jgi:transcription termination factor Rho
MWVMRKYLADMNPVEAMEFINDRFKQTRNNEEFLNLYEWIKLKIIFL